MSDTLHVSLIKLYVHIWIRRRSGIVWYGVASIRCIYCQTNIDAVRHMTTYMYTVSIRLLYTLNGIECLGA